VAEAKNDTEPKTELEAKIADHQPSLNKLATTRVRDLITKLANGAPADQNPRQFIATLQFEAQKILGLD